LRVESARIAQKLDSVSWQIGASVPPASITVASPRRMTSAASPIACELAAQAVAIAVL
jgi:hypothetical protein